MNNMDENMEWEREAPYLAGLSRVTPYSVPGGYFKDLPLHVNQAVFLAGIGHQENQGFTVPKNYFDELSHQIESRIAVAELNKIVNSDGFKTPDNYFDQLQQEILSKTAGAAPKTRVFKLWHSEAMKYVSAACFIVLAASGLYLNQQHTVQQLAKTELAGDQMLYDIDESVIFEHLEESQAANTTSASDTEMENYILDNFSSNELSSSL